MTVPASLSKWAHPPRSNAPRSSSSGPPGPCITPSTETCAVVVSFMVAVPLLVGLVVVRVRRAAGHLVVVAGRSSGRANGALGADRVDLADGLRQAFLRAHGEDLLHGLGTGEGGLDRHPRAPGPDRLDPDASRGLWELGVRRAIVVGEAVAELEAMRWIDCDHI